MRNSNTRTGYANRSHVKFMLDTLLADEYILYIKTRNYHRNVKGPQIQSMSLFFELQCFEIEMMIEEITNQLSVIGNQPDNNYSDYLGLARLLESNQVDEEPEKMLRTLLADHKTVFQILRNDLTEDLDTYDEFGLADFLEGLMKKHRKLASMIRSYLG